VALLNTELDAVIYSLLTAEQRKQVLSESECAAQP
jgi:Spy/CpxP family protein refolding chaperone